MARVPHVRDEHGFTIVEVIVAATVLVIGVLGVVTMVDGANARTTQSRAREGGTNLARELTEQARLVPYSKAGQDQIATELRAVDGLADSNTGLAGWQVQRRKRDYTVAVESCLMDDPNDGVGTHDSNFCAGAGAGGTDDDNPRDYRRITFDINWTAQGVNRQVRQTTLLTPRGTADLPRTTSFSLLSPSYSGTADAPIITTATSPVSFRATTSIAAAGVSWLIDGAPRGVTSNAAGASSWDWNWNISSLVDGTYTVSAQPFDSSGAAGIASEKTIKLNRFAPAALAPVYAGWNSGSAGSNLRSIDVEWIASRERDVVGYRVYEQIYSSTSATNPPPITKRVCPTASSTDSYTTKVTCSTTYATNLPSGYDRLKYWVVAVDKTGATDVLREGTASTNIEIYARTNTPPNPIPGAANAITLSQPGNGTNVLTWAQGNDPDTTSTNTVCAGNATGADCVLYYRIYRNGVRYGSTPYETPPPAGTARQFIDVAPTASTPCYSVVAVDTRLREGTARTAGTC